MKERKRRRDSLTNRKRRERVVTSFSKKTVPQWSTLCLHPFTRLPGGIWNFNPFCRDCTPNCYTSYKCISSAHSFHGPTNPGELSHPLLRLSFVSGDFFFFFFSPELRGNAAPGETERKKVLTNLNYGSNNRKCD